MRLILLGTPGAGKGEQAARLSKKFQIPHISTGELLRAEMEAGTEVGLQITEFVNTGELVSDKITQSLLVERLGQADCESGFILDGFPRNKNQAGFLGQALEEMKKPIDVVLNIEVTDETVIDRLTIRNRKDDTLETIKRRLKIFRKVTAPLVDYYNQTETLKRMDGNGTIEQVTQRILDRLKQLA